MERDGFDFIFTILVLEDSDGQGTVFLLSFHVPQESPFSLLKNGTS